MSSGWNRGCGSVKKFNSAENDRKPSPRCAQPWLLPLMAAAWNQLIYYGGNFLAVGRPHGDWTLPIDLVIPFLPWTVLIYLGCFLFWAAQYLFIARQSRSEAYRFFLADFLAKAMCLPFFLFLPTTNIRPAVEGTALWDSLLRLVYQIDAPTNLFPSIHCLVSWLCWIGVRGRRDIPSWHRQFSLVMALAVCVSTLTTRQHVILDVAGGILLAELGYWAAGLRPLAVRYAKIVNRITKRSM